MIAESLDLLSRNPFLVKHIRKVYKHILVDEFQDTNHSQCRILSLITKPGGQGDVVRIFHFDDLDDEADWIARDIARQDTSARTNCAILAEECQTGSQEDESASCFTIHASKGMEFGHVYLMGLVEDQLPSWAAVKKGDESLEMQEERRNCFVAITRAQEKLTLTFSAQLFGWPKKPSRFLAEMGIEL